MKISRKDNNGGLVLVCAVRYALGRYTYMPEHIIGELSSMIKDIPTRSLRIIAMDIEDEIKMYDRTPGLDLACRDKWIAFKGKIEEELDERVKEVMA